MIANFFSKSEPVKIFYLMLVLLLYFSGYIYYTQTFELSVSYFLQKFSIYVGFLFLLLVVDFIKQKNGLTQDNSYAILLMVLMIGSMPVIFENGKLLLVNIFLLLSFRKVYSLKSNSNTIRKLFDAGFWIAIAALIDPVCIVFLLLVFVASFLYHKFSIRYLFVPLIGALTPLLLVFTYRLLFEDVYLWNSIELWTLSFDFTPYFNLELMIPVGLLIVLLLLSLIGVVPRTLMVSNKFKFSWNVLLIHLLLSIIVVTLNPLKNGSEVLFVLFPSVILISNYLQMVRSTFFRNGLIYIAVLVSLTYFIL